MESPVLVILAILGAGALFVLLPVALTALSEHRSARAVVCPETGRQASIGLDAGRAARGAIFGREWLKIERCSLWPEKEGCAEACIRPAAEPAEAAGEPRPAPG
jgi:hypothetical protein